MPNGIGSRLKTGPSQTGQLPGRIKSELCDLSGLRIDLIPRLLSLSRLYSGILHSLSLSISAFSSGSKVSATKPGFRPASSDNASARLPGFGAQIFLSNTVSGLGFRGLGG